MSKLRPEWTAAFIRNTVQAKLFSSRYEAAAQLPVKEGSVVFLEVRDRTLSDNFRLIRAALERRNAKSARYSISIFCIREELDSQLTIVRSCMKAIPVLARAQYIFVDGTSAFLESLPVRSGTTVIQTWYACGAFKRFGYSLNKKESGINTGKRGMSFGYRNQSYVTVSSPEVVWAYAEAFHMEDRVDRIQPVGVSRTDMFFSKKYREIACGKVTWLIRRMAPALFLGSEGSGKEQDKGAGAAKGGKMYARLGDFYTDRAGTEAFPEDLQIVPGRKVILYAPTYRGSASDASSPNRLDIPMMKRELGDRYILLVNHHPFVKEKDRPKIPEKCQDFAFDVTGRLSIEELLTAADACITDYSSLVFEYSLFERPILFFTYDMQEYLDETGFYYPIREMMPGPVCSTTQELTEVFRTPDTEFNLLRIREFKYRFMSGCDGHATARILQLMDHAAGEKDPEK